MDVLTRTSCLVFVVAAVVESITDEIDGNAREEDARRSVAEHEILKTHALNMTRSVYSVMWRSDVWRHNVPHSSGSSLRSGQSRKRSHWKFSGIHVTSSSHCTSPTAQSSRSKTSGTVPSFPSLDSKTRDDVTHRMTKVYSFVQLTTGFCCLT